MKNFLLVIMSLASVSSYAGVSANVSFTTDYIWRGMTQSDGPAVQGGFDYEADSGFYAGFWGSNVNFNNGNGQELDYYAGYGFSLGDVGVDVGYITYDYPDSDPDLKFEEIYLGFSIGDLGLTYASGQDEAPDYIEVSYGIGPVSISYGDYDEYGENTLISYGFACGSYECGISLYDFSDAGYGADEDGVFFSISASL
jgi:uncharacterized protein (TIGR02001 family)|tara:strand:- start:305 stop:898 length:594 start_codon:yes stop_codon:yes gene_type:complete